MPDDESEEDPFPELEDGTPHFAEIKPPSEKPPHEYSVIERRARLYRMIEEAGHPRNLRQNQSELGERFGVSQTMISKDMGKLREYQRARSGKRAVSTTRWLGEKAVIEMVDSARVMMSRAKQLEQRARELEEEGRRDSADEMYEDAAKFRRRGTSLYEDAHDTQMEYNEFLFQLGSLEEAPDRVEFSGDAGDAYMQMLREVAGDDES